MEMKWKLEMDTGNRKQKWKCNLLALVVILMLLVFTSSHPNAVPSPVFALATPSCSVMCDSLVFLTWVINPRCACAARVTVLGLYHVSVCVSVTQHLTFHMIIRAKNDTNLLSGG